MQLVFIIYAMLAWADTRYHLFVDYLLCTCHLLSLCVCDCCVYLYMILLSGHHKDFSLIQLAE